MANAYSTPIQYKPYESEWDSQLLATALTYKQQTYDANRQKVQNYLNEFSQIDLVKAEDQEHFYNNLKMLKEEVDGYGMGDLSQSGVADKLAAHIGQAADEKVVNGYAGTLQYRNYQNQWSKIKEESPELYSEANYQYGLTNFNQWVTDGKAGSSLGTYKNNWIGAGIGEVNPYFDKTQHIIDVFKEHKPNIKVVQTKNGVQYLNEKHEIVSKEEVDGILGSFVYSDPRFNQQMKIDSWDAYGNVPNEQVSSTIKGGLQVKKQGLEEALSKAEKKYASSKGDEKKQYGEYIESLKQQVTQYTTDINNWDSQFAKNPEHYKQFLYKQQFNQQIHDIYEKDNIIGVTSITDVAALEALKHSYAMTKLKAQNKQTKLDEHNKKLLELHSAGKVGEMTRYANALTNMGVGVDPDTGVSYDWNGVVNTLKNSAVTAFDTPDEIDSEIGLDEVQTSLVNKYQDIQNQKTEINAGLASLGMDYSLVSTEDVSDLMTVLNDEYENPATSDDKRAKITKLNEELVSYSNAQRGMNNVLERVVETNVLEGVDGVRVGGIGSAKVLQYDDNTGQYFIQDEKTWLEAAGNDAKILGNLGVGAVNMVSILGQNISRDFNVFEFKPYQNKKAVDAAHLFFTDREAFDSAYPPSVKKWTEDWEGYSSVRDLYDNNIGFQKFAGAVENIESVSAPIDYFEFNDDPFLKPTREYLTNSEVSELLTDKLLNGELNKPLRQALGDDIVNEFNETGFLGKGLSLSDSYNQNRFGSDVNAIMGTNIDFSDNKFQNAGIILSEDGVTITVQDEEDEKPISRVLTLQEAMSYPEVGAVVQEYSSNISQQNIITTVEKMVKDNVLKDETGNSKQIPVTLEQSSVTLPSGQNLDIKTTLAESINQEEFVANMIINGETVDNYTKVFNLFEANGTPLTEDFSPYFDFAPNSDVIQSTINSNRNLQTLLYLLQNSIEDDLVYNTETTLYGKTIENLVK